MVTYSYGPGKYNTSQLQSEILAKGGGLANVSAVNGSGYNFPAIYATLVDVVFPTALSAQDKTTLDGVVAAHIALPDPVPVYLGANVLYCTKPADYQGGVNYPALVAQVLSNGAQVNVAYLDTTGAWFKDGPIPFLQSGRPLPGSKGFAFWPGYSPNP